MAAADAQRPPIPAHELGRSTAELPILRSNRGEHVASAATGWMLTTSRDARIAEMRARYERDGYIWVKNIIPRSDVLDMREQ